MRKLISGLYYKVIKALIFSKILNDIRFHKVFNEQLYLERNPEIDPGEIDPLLHFLLYGRLEGRDTEIWFDLCYDLDRSGAPRTGLKAILPWILNHKRLICRRTKQESLVLLNKRTFRGGSIAERVIEPSSFMQQYQSPELNPLYEKDLIISHGSPPVNLIAFYYSWHTHKTENINCGFPGRNDWRTVAGALPLFPGHQQPKLPGELGYYDIRVPEVMQRQVGLAMSAGIQGFCFDLPTAAAFCLRKDPDFRFCLRDFSQPVHNKYPVNIPMGQLTAILYDKRYIRIGKKPLIIVRNADACKLWRKRVEKFLPDGVFMVMAPDNQESWLQLKNIGCEAFLDLPPFNANTLPVPSASEKLFPGFRGKHFIYSDIVNQSKILENRDITVFRGVFPAWDDTALKTTPDIFSGSSPDLYQEWLSDMMDWTLRNNQPDRQFLFINAWNDWAHGCYLEPGRTFGYGYINATVRASHALTNNPANEK